MNTTQPHTRRYDASGILLRGIVLLLPAFLIAVGMTIALS